MGSIKGYAIIFLIYLLFKGCNYAQMEKTEGTVIDQETFTYGSAFRGGGGRDIVPYPIAKFKGPARKTRPNIDFSSLSRQELDSIHQYATAAGPEFSVSNAINNYLDYKRSILVESTDYITTEPTGAYFFKEYKMGEKVKVIYDQPDNAIVCTLFSFWFTLPSLSILILLCLVWTGIYRIKTKQY
ncbi:MAG: hypothetical protein R2800_07330 [Flavipsychrobacter sp.]